MSLYLKTRRIIAFIVLYSSSICVQALTQYPVQAPEFEEVSLVATAYYSPVPGQKYYLRGDYEQEVILNGRGTHGASGKAVFEGMIAAPKDYWFGTKIWIEGLWVGSVEDRGGAIVNAWVRGHAYDRVDIWMGSGEAGLARSLAWGKRTVKARVYSSKSTQVAFSTGHLAKAQLSSSVAKVVTPAGMQVASTITQTSIAAPRVLKSKVQIASLDEKLVYFDQLRSNLRTQIHLTDVQGVRNIQEALRTLGFFTSKSTGRVGPATLQALNNFEKSAKLPLSRTGLTETTQTALINALIARGIDSVGLITSPKKAL